MELDRTPALGPIYRRAAMGVVSRRSGGDTMPDEPLTLRGVTVDTDHLAAYDRVCGFRLTDTLPATYPHILAFPLAMSLMSGPDFPFPIIGLVHVANRITVHRALSTGDTFDLTVHAENLRPHDRGRQLDVVATATVDGNEVWRGVSTYLRREGEATKSERRDAGERPPGSAIWKVPGDIGRDYADVSGDRNPIHTSRVGARLFGFARPIAHGMWSKARCLAALEGRLPDAYTVDVSFKLPILLPSTVAFAAEPEWSFSLHDAKSGKPHLTGTVGGPAE